MNKPDVLNVKRISNKYGFGSHRIQSKYFHREIVVSRTSRSIWKFVEEIFFHAAQRTRGDKKDKHLSQSEMGSSGLPAPTEVRELSV